MRFQRCAPYLCAVFLMGCYHAEPPQAEMAAEAMRAPTSAAIAPSPAKVAVAIDAPHPSHNTEAYDHQPENDFQAVAQAPLSTFAVDVDTASYSNVRRLLRQGVRPPAGAVRIEELINYFTYDYPQPTGGVPFSVYTEVGAAPWAPEHTLLHIGLQGRTLDFEQLPPRNLVFLIDVSGSMQSPQKLPLLQQSLMALVETLRPQDTVGMVVYAGASGVVLEPTRGDQKRAIVAAIDRLKAGGGTNGAAGIELAYRLAESQMRPGTVNRVLLATDGDFNVGPTSQSDLVELIEQKRETGVFLTVLGYGMGNYKDSTLEKLADHGNGNYAYIDDLREARKVLVEEGGATLVTLAKDVKIQVEFNPAVVGAYRLVGYENRMLAARDFNDDQKDAGEIGAGHSVTAIYELLSPAQVQRLAGVDALRYETPRVATPSRAELATVKLRYKAPQAQTSRRLEVAVSSQPAFHASETFRFSAAVAAFGMVLRDSKYKGAASLAMAHQLAAGALGRDWAGHRRDFLALVKAADRVR